jgi:hypothetical protein
MKPTQFDEPADVIEPVDEDLLFIVEVLQEHATPEQVAEYERRYLEDDAFRLKAGPLVEFWLLDLDLDEITGDVQEGSAPVAVPNVESTPTQRPSVAAAAKAPAGNAKTGKGSSMKDLRYIALRVLLFGALAFAAYVAYQFAMFFRATPDGVIAVMRVSPKASAVPAAATERPAGGLPPSAGPEPARYSSAILMILDASGANVSTSPTEMKVVEMRGGSRLTLRPGSTIRHGKLPGLPFGVIVELDGEMTVDVTSGDEIVDVSSKAGSAMLGPGSYALRCVRVCAALEVTVGRGSATLKPDLLNGPASLELKDGQWGRAYRDAAPDSVPALAAKDFPLPRSNFRTPGVRP